MRRFAAFALKVTAAHTLTYVVVGAAAYHLIVKPFYVGDRAAFASFMRTESEPELWAHAMRWLLPAQLLRGALMAAALSPLRAAIEAKGFGGRLLTIAGIYLVFGYWASCTAAVGTIEGLVYLRPEFTARMHMMVQPEIVLQALAFGTLLAAWLGPRGGARREA